MFDNITQVNVHGSHCCSPCVKNQFTKVPTSISKQTSQPRCPAWSTLESEEECEVFNLDLATMLAKVFPNLMLLRMGEDLGDIEPKTQQQSWLL